MNSRISFVGNASFNALDSKMPYVRVGTTKSGKAYKTLNMAISSEKNCRANLELFGMVKDTINQFDNDGNKIEIDWEDRNDPEVVSSCRNVFRVDLDGDKHTFITELDMIDFVCDHIDDLKKYKVMVTGGINKNIYQGKISDRFTIKNIYTVNEDTKNGLKVTMEFFWNKDSYDFADWKEEKVVRINGYTNDFISKDALGEAKGANRYVPQTVVLDCSKIDFNNEKHVALMKFKMKQLGIEYVDDKPKATIGKGYHKLAIICKYVNGAEEKPFDESMLTPTQKEMIELGMKTVDDFRPAGSIYGERVTVYKVSDFDLRGEYENGLVKCDDTDKEFEELIFTPVKEESVDDMQEDTPVKTESSNTSADDDDDDLF